VRSSAWLHRDLANPTSSLLQTPARYHTAKKKARLKAASTGVGPQSLVLVLQRLIEVEHAHQPDSSTFNASVACLCIAISGFTPRLPRMRSCRAPSFITRQQPCRFGIVTAEMNTSKRSRSRVYTITGSKDADYSKSRKPSAVDANDVDHSGTYGDRALGFRSGAPRTRHFNRLFTCHRYIYSGLSLPLCLHFPVSHSLLH
jgi:hypothetical protein